MRNVIYHPMPFISTLLVILFCLHQAIGYSFMPTTKDEDGLVGLLTKKSLPDLENNQQASVNFLTGLLCVQPTLSVCVDSVRELPDKK